jgi:hypothetical protein
MYRGVDEEMRGIMKKACDICDSKKENEEQQKII